MAALEWAKAGERFYETGLDRGVLYTRDGNAVVWNGLTNVAENTEFEVKSYWMDGVKYLDRSISGSYSAKLEAFTYPDVLDELTGVMRYAPGVYLHDQTAKIFHLSYRTGVGNEISQDLGYKLHIVYNVMAVPSGAAMGTLGETVEPGKFTWDLRGTPPAMFGARPTSHIHLDTRYISPELLETIEGILYGTVLLDPLLPPMVYLLNLIETSQP
jgi:hypothetical protein